MKTSSNFLDKFPNTDESSCWSNIVKIELWKNDVGVLFSKAAQNNGQPGRLKKRSDCKACISRFLDLDVPDIYVAQLSAWLPEPEKFLFIQISIHST